MNEVLYRHTSFTFTPQEQTMQLIYRGQAFNYSPAFLLSTVVTDGVIRTLVYRGHTYHCQFATKRLIRLPKAINWCFADVSEQPQPHLRPAH